MRRGASGLKAVKLWVRLSCTLIIRTEDRNIDAWVDGNKTGEIWAIALSEDGQYLAATSSDGRINVWDNLADGAKIREFETKGSFGMSIDLVRIHGPLHYIYLRVFSPWMADLRLQDTRTVGSISSITTLEDSSIPYQVDMSIYLLRHLIERIIGLVKTVRAVAFSPGGKLLAAAGDSKVIALYDVSSGEQVANLTGHGAWIFSLGWSDTGEYLLSG